MSPTSKKWIGAGASLFLLILGGWLFFFSAEPIPTETIPVAIPAEVVAPEVVVEKIKTIGYSVEGRAIETYTYGTGSTTLLFVGGVHGGYEWNSTLLAYEFIDNLENNSVTVPENISVIIIPTLNPDGLFSVIQKEGRFTTTEIPKNNAHQTGAGRFNSNEVDLNRNFDCQWQPKGTWQNRTVSGGNAAFSEPEAQAIRDYVLASKPAGVITWYSAAGGVYASTCNGEVETETLAITKLFAEASGYTAHEEFDYYEITGDMVNWFAKENIPAISVLLTNHTATELNKNKAGIEALLNYFK